MLEKARAFLEFFDFVLLSWLLYECDCRQRASLSMKNQDSIGRLRRERFGGRTSDYGTTYNLADMELSTLQKEALYVVAWISVFHTEHLRT